MAQGKRRQRRSFGHLRKLPSGRFQASYLDPGSGKRIAAPTTFTAKTDADAWLSIQRAALETGTWRGPGEQVTVGEYAEQWFAAYSVKPSTYQVRRAIYDKRIKPTFATTPMDAVTVPMVRRWVASFSKDEPTARVNAYKLLAQIFRDAVSDRIIASSPVLIKGATQAPAPREGHALTPAEVQQLADHMPKELRLAVLLAAYCALRPGETLALRTRDLDQKNHLLHVRETASSAAPGVDQVRAPKTPGSLRTVNYPGQLHDDVDGQIREHATPGKRGHLFPSPRDQDRPLSMSAYGNQVRAAAERAGLADVRPHDLRHSGLTMAAATGATVTELMARAGHSSPDVAMRYQHAVRERDRAIADALGAVISNDAEGNDDDEAE